MRRRLVMWAFGRSLFPEHRLFVIGVGVMGALVVAFSSIISHAANSGVRPIEWWKLW